MHSRNAQEGKTDGAAHWTTIHVMPESFVLPLGSGSGTGISQALSDRKWHHWAGQVKVHRLGPAPLRTAFCRRWMLWLVTLSGKVSVVATWMGTPTSLIARLGSGEMTVRPEKSTLLPDRFPLKRPCLPFSRCTKPLQHHRIEIL